MAAVAIILMLSLKKELIYVADIPAFDSRPCSVFGLIPHACAAHGVYVPTYLISLPVTAAVVDA